jgi:hypothetical protein
MNSTTKLRFLATPLALAALIAPLASCGDIGAQPLPDFCCKDFVPGADVLTVDWGIEGEAGLTFGAFMQAAADFSGAANAVVNDVAGACQAIAIDLGASPTAVKESAPDKRVTAWCNEAVARIGQAGVKGKISISVQPPVCTANVSAQANCEASCTASVECEAELGNVELRCDPGELSGTCEAQCTGTCEGSANLAVNCEGKCNGTCEGKCTGGSNTGGNCTGTCEGTCRGSCEMAADADVQCNGSCTGGCSVALKAPKCTGKLKPPSASCQGSADCNASCEASASARIECKEPSVEISGAAEFQAVITTLKLNLPKIFAVAQVRGELLLENAGAVLDISAKLDPGELSVKGGACLIPAAAAIGQSVANIEASLTASVSVVGSVQ